MVYQKFCVHPEKLIQQILVIVITVSANGTSGNISHCINALGCQLRGISSPDPPEIRNRLMIPQQFPVAHLVESRYPDTILIRRHMLGNNIHRDLTQIHIRAYSCSCRNSRSIKNISYHTHGKFAHTDSICIKIRCNIHKHFIYRIYQHILRGDIFKVYAVYPLAVFNIPGHLRSGSYI